MARNHAYQHAEQEIETAGKLRATELSLDVDHEADDAAKLSELPEALWQLSHLETLSLAGNQLTALPEVLGRLT